MIRPVYDTDLTNDQWQILEPLIPVAKPGGRPRSLDMREILNAIFYLLANGALLIYGMNQLFSEPTKLTLLAL